MPACRQLVLGLGNRLNGEDAFGPLVVDRVRDLAAIPGVEVEDAGCDLLAWLDRLASYDHVIVIDAVLGLSNPGTVTILAEADLASWSDTSADCHQISPVAAIKLFRTLHPGAATRLTLVALSSARISPDDVLAAAVVARGAENVILAMRHDYRPAAR